MPLVNRTALLKHDLVIAQGTDMLWAFSYARETGGVETPVDFVAEGYTARSQIRQRVGGTVWHTFEDIELTAEGRINLRLPSAVSEGWALRDGSEGVWDLELVKPGDVIRFAEGKVRFSGDVTRND